MQVAEFNPDDFNPSNQQAADANLLVRFMIKPMLDQDATNEAGRPIYRDIEYIDIRQPGSPDNVVRPASARDKERFPRHYAAFKNRVGNEEYIEGTLLSEWPMVNRSQVEELAFFGVKTVEQLAGCSDAHAQNFMGFNGLKQKANEWLKVAKEQVAKIQLQAELNRRDAEIENLRSEIEALKKGVMNSKVPGRKKVSKKKAVEAEQEAETASEE